MTALDGRLRGRGGGTAPAHCVGDFLPVSGLEVPATEGVPLVAVSVDEGDGLVVGPTRRREAARVDGGRMYRRSR